MLKKGLAVSILAILSPLFSQSSLDRLASRSADEILALCKAPKPIVAVVEFCNYSFLSDVQVQTFYQILAMKLEQSGKVNYRDLLVDFSAGKGRFNLSDLNRIRYGLFLVMYDTPKGLAFSAAVRLLESSKLLGLVYQSETISVDEMWAVSQLASASPTAALLLQRQESYRIDNTVFCLIQDLDSSTTKDLYALTPDQLIVWQAMMPNQGQGRKIPLKWPFPKTPSIQNEGRMSFIKVGPNRYLTVGSNFSTQSLVMRITPQEAVPVASLPFVPLWTAQLGGEPYLVGCRFVPGANRYDGSLQLLNLSAWTSESASPKTAQKRMDSFYDMTVLNRPQQLNALFWVDENNRLNMADAQWNPLLSPERMPASGANAVCVAGRWLLTSGSDELNDTLQIYGISDGGLLPIGSQTLEGRIHSMSEGLLEGKPGAWVLRFLDDAYGRRTSWLDFWRFADAEK